MPTDNSFWGRKFIPRFTSDAARTAIQWFRNRFRNLTGLKTKKNFQTLSVEIGKMYAYRYDPKWKNVLPLYDTQPLVIVIEKYHDGFLGLNMHYLPIRQRYQLLGALWKLASGDMTTTHDTLIISYRILQSAAKSTLYKPTIHRYLYSHVRTKFAEIHPTEWKVAIALPTAKFKKGVPY